MHLPAGFELPLRGMQESVEAPNNTTSTRSYDHHKTHAVDEVEA